MVQELPNITWQLKKYDDLTRDELFKIAGIRQEVFVLEQKCIYRDLDENDFCSLHLYGLDDNGAIMTYCRVIPQNEFSEFPKIGRVLVKQKYRGMKLNQQLLARALQAQREIFNNNQIYISAQAHLEKMYAQAGFKRISDIYMEDGIEHCRMIYKF